MGVSVILLVSIDSQYQKILELIQYPMRIKTEIYEGVFVVTCDGTRLDASFAQKFFNSMRGFIQKGHTDIVLELSKVQFVDSTGLGAIIRCLKEINSRGHLVLCGVSENVLSLLKMTHLDAVFLRAKDLAGALQILKREKERAEEELARKTLAREEERVQGFDPALLESLSMEDGEQVQEVDTTERRRHRRVEQKQITNNNIVVYITNRETGKRTAAVILNISASGLLAVSPSKHSVGDSFLMEGRIGTNFKLKERVIIRNCMDGKYGFEFVKPSEKTTLFLHQMTGSVVLDGKGNL